MAYSNLEPIALGILGNKTPASVCDRIYCPDFTFLIFQVKLKVQLRKISRGMCFSLVNV